MEARVPLALLAVLPASLLMAYFLVGDIAVLADPCHTWGASGSSTMTPEDACASGRSGSSQTLREYLLMALAVKGSVFASLAVAALGILTARGWVAVMGAALTSVVSVPLLFGGTGHVVLLSAALVLAAARLAGDLRGRARWGARVLALLLAGFYGLQLAGALASGMPAFAIFSLVVMVVPVLALWAAWWPAPHSEPSTSPGS